MFHWRTLSFAVLALLALQSCITQEPTRVAASDTTGNLTNGTTDGALSKEQPSAQSRSRRRTPEEVGALNVAKHREYVMRVRSQKRDAEWATKTELAIRKEIPELLQDTATFINADCRTSACLVLIEWKSYVVAQANWERLVLGALPVECDRGITLSIPDDQMQTYRELLVLANCKR